MSGSGRRAAFAASAFAALVLAAAAFVFRQEILERWHLHRLEHGSLEAKRSAAEKLAGMKSARAVPLLIENLRKEIGPITFISPSGVEIDGRRWRDFWPATTLTKIGGPAVDPLMTIYEEESGAVAKAAGLILKEIGPEALPVIKRYMEEHPLFTPHWMIEAVGRMGPDAKPAVPALLKVIRYGDEKTVCAALHALVEIGVDEASYKAIFELREHQAVAVREIARLALIEIEIERARSGR